jgi:hypothetical protein
VLHQAKPIEDAAMRVSILWGTDLEVVKHAAFIEIMAPKNGGHQLPLCVGLTAKPDSERKSVQCLLGKILDLVSMEVDEIVRAQQVDRRADAIYDAQVFQALNPLDESEGVKALMDRIFQRRPRSQGRWARTECPGH